ncbi:MAG TPA: DUF1345 domain-containing protein [Alphaproteobacteria bacterium]|jgi:uncharacterized membrane protein|nr:DUF1345 domain-containing protein [Alphaproteobacteria bacterium]
MVAKTKAPAAPPPAHHIAWLPWVRLATGIAVGFAVYTVLPHHHGPVIRAVLGWDFGVFVLSGWIMAMMATSTNDHMRRRAERQDLGRWVILLAIIAGALVSMIALAVIQKSLKAGSGDESVLYIGLIVTTIVLSWSLVHTVFSLHYAHAYYGPADEPDDEDGLIGGLEFPSEDKPDYWDFMYFSYVVGMTCQVSDVEVSGRHLRRLTLIHGVVSFFFNTIILALTINIVASSF